MRHWLAEYVCGRLFVELLFMLSYASVVVVATRRFSSVSYTHLTLPTILLV